MKRILHFYIFREIAAPFLLSFAVFTFVLLMGKFLKLAEMVISKGVPLADMVHLVTYMLPSFCVITIPMSFLFAVLLAFGRLSADCEITAMKAGRISLYGMLPPVMTFATLTFLATMYITVYALPWGNSSFKLFIYDVVKTKVSLSLKDKVFNDDFPGMVLYVDHYDQAKHVIYDILIYDDRKTDVPSTIFAKSGVIDSDPRKKLLRLSLKNGSIHRNTGKENYQLIEFASYDLSINLHQSAGEMTRDELDMTFTELRNHLRTHKADDRYRRNMLIEFHKRLSLPFACFIFALIGMPLGTHNQRSGKAAGFSKGIGIILLYYIMFSTGKTLGQKGIIYPAVAMWIPNLAFLCIGVYLFRQTAAERMIPIFQLPATIAHRVRTRLSKRVKLP